VKRAVRVLRRAQRDLVEIQTYVWRDNPAAAERLVEGLLRQIERLGDLPLRGALPKDSRLRVAGYRHVARGEYLIFYKVLPSVVRVYRVLHGRRRYQHLL
jgi:toxin ParE1/3/4